MDYQHRWISSKKDEVEDFVYRHGSPFQSYAFLKAVGKDYECQIVENDRRELQAVTPLVKIRKYGRRAYYIPNYTYQFGPVIPSSCQDTEGVLVHILTHLPPSGFYDFKLPLGKQARDVFRQMGFTLSKMKSHWVDKEDAYELSTLSSDKRRDIRKLLKEEKRGNIRIIENREDNIEKILWLWKRTGKRSAFDIHRDKVGRILKAGLPHYNNVIEDKKGRALSGTFCPYNERIMYHMIGAGIRVEDSLLSRTHMLALYRAIQQAQNQGLHFDTEGSMISGVAKFYQRMGAAPIALYRAQKANDLYFRFLKMVKDLKGSAT